MAPTPTHNQLKDDAGLHSLAPKLRGRKHIQPEHTRRYVDVPEMIPESTPLKSSQSEKTLRSSKSGSPRRMPVDDRMGMSSCELAKSHELGRGRRHISYGTAKVEAMRTPSTPSEASEMMSEASADFHLGPRGKFKDERWKELLEAERESVGYDFEDEQISGATSHHLSRKGKLGAGRRKCKEFEWAVGHPSDAVNDPGGPTIFEDTAANPGSFLGACRRRCNGMSKSQEQQIDLVGARPPPEPLKRGKKIFQDHYEEPPAASPEIPVGVSQQIDLHTKGFLGKRRGGEGKGKAQISMGPIEDKSKEPRDIYDLTCYGLHHRGKRKFLVQNNLDTSCRHDTSRGPLKTAESMNRSQSKFLESDLPPNQTPYYQDNLEEHKRAVKGELNLTCRSNKEVDRKMPPRAGVNHVDNTWSSMTWTPRKADMETASSFIEGEDMSPRRYQKNSAKYIEGQNLIHDITDNDHYDTEMRAAHGPAKRSFGNAHNKSSLRFEYNDNADHKVEMHRNDGHRWGPGHGRKRFDVADHLYEAEDGIQPYMSSGGFPLGKSKAGQHKPEPDLMGPFSPGKASEKDLTSYMGPDGKMHHNRPAVKIKDNVNDILDYEKECCESDADHTLGISGTRRKGEMIRPQSARRFPQRDFERTEPKSVRPRTPDPYANKPITARPLWKKATNVH